MRETALYTVYHANPNSFQKASAVSYGFGKDKLFMNDYTIVAEVRVWDEADVVTELEKVYHDTNHIEEDWTKGQNVCMNPDLDGARSTSMGDIVMDKNGMYWMVAGLGFTRITIDEETAEIAMIKRGSK